MRRSLASLLLLLSLTSAPAFATPLPEVHVFIYHRFGESRYPSTNIDLGVFEKQLQILRDGRYNVLPLGEVVRRLRAGEALPLRCAVLTIDDAYGSFVRNGYPLLRHYGLPATLFVDTDAVGSRDYARWEDLRTLQRGGIEIGNHSAGHAYLLDRRPGEDRDAWKERIRSDIRRAQKRLRAELGAAAQLFAYPFGEYDASLQEIVREEGFQGAAAQTSGVIAPGVDFFALPRFPMGGVVATVAGFQQKLQYHALPVAVIDPLSSVLVSARVPDMLVEIAPGSYDLARLQCFVDGRPDGCRIAAETARAGLYRVSCNAVVTGRRSKVTLTAPGTVGWYWFSQLWILPGR